MGLALLELSPAMLLTLLNGRYEVVAHGVPEGARFHDGIWDEPRQCLVLILEHPDFADVPAGALLPRLEAPHVKRLE